MRIAASAGLRLATVIVSVLAALAACKAGPRDAGAGIPAAAPAEGAAGLGMRSLAAPAAAATTCDSADPHTRHLAEGYDCALCHSCAGVLAFGAFTFPGGSTTAGGTISMPGGVPTCSVGCHSPLGAASQPVAWDAGPLDCISCHSSVTAAGSIGARSSHFAAGAASVTCQSCHDQSRHTEGEVRLVGADGTSTASTCTGCHAGQGQTLAGATPPLLVGWTDLAPGDFHGPRSGTCRFDRLDEAGARSVGVGAHACPPGQPEPPGALRITSRWWYASGTTGPWAWTCDIETVDAAGGRIGPVLLAQPCPEGTFLNSWCNDPRRPTGCYPVNLVTRGFGGTLRDPYARGQGPLPCAACHDAHASTNAFLLAAAVNGVALPAESIDRAGVGAQALCAACHEGERHEPCKACHKERWVTDGEYSWFEGEPVDPAPDGSACFYCHGHEGIRHMRVSSPEWPGDGHPFGIAGRDKGEDACSHCHSAWRPPPIEYQAPVFRSAPAVSGLTATGATVRWQTWERATTYVEYGAGAAGYVAGNDAFAYDHAVTLTGLVPGTAYVWRVRTSDVFRNVTHPALATFTTTSADGVPFPDLAPVSAGAHVGTYTMDVALVWFPVTAPSGGAIEYEVQLASDPDFTYLVNGSMAGPGVPGLSVGDSGWIGGTPATFEGTPALSHPATLTDIPQDWCGDIVPNVYYWRVRARDGQGRVSEWSPTGTFGAFAGDPLC